FKGLKKSYAKGIELRGKTLGIIGFGRIGQEVAKIAIGAGMQVVAADKFIDKATLSLDFMGGHNIAVDIATQPMEEVLKVADFISLHVPAQKNYVIDKAVLQ
ncbi:MAG: NAD(P)-dependent oxidoreductase, partial [Flavobacteriales bacterium]